MTLPEEHRKETARLIKERSSTKAGRLTIANWLLKDGYYPEPFVIPPCFKISNFELRNAELSSDLQELKSHELLPISFPKTGLIERVFSIIHPSHYHDIVYALMKDWKDILKTLFDKENKIYSYSFPIPVSSSEKDYTSELRSGRMIYEFLQMAEKDLVAESHNYKVLAKVDITNFYNSVYTHSIPWALIGNRYQALKVHNNYDLLGNKLDRLFQYSNDRKTVGLPVGPSLSDLIIEIILSERDKRISNEIKNKGLDFLATRFKDDYRILCQSESDADTIIKVIIKVLGEFNLQVNESKTKKMPLPDGLYRKHSLQYEPHSLRSFREKDNIRKVPFRKFEHSLLMALEIHREFSGTSLLEKFLGEIVLKASETPLNAELWDRINIQFVSENIPIAKRALVRKSNVRKTISLLLQIKNESPKSLGKVLSIIECLMNNPQDKWMLEDGYLFDIVLKETENALIKGSAFELCWWLFFGKKHLLEVDIKRTFKALTKSGRLSYKMTCQCEVLSNPFVATILDWRPSKRGGVPDPFGGNGINIGMYIDPKETIPLIDYLDVFNREELEPDS